MDRKVEKMQEVINFVNKMPIQLIDITKRKKRERADTHCKTWLCIKNSVREKNERRLTRGTMMVDETKSESWKI